MKIISSEFIGSFRDTNHIQEMALRLVNGESRVMKNHRRYVREKSDTGCEDGGKNTKRRSFLPEIVFCGRSNVGKSSVINTLLGRKRLAKTSTTPGKTRGLNTYLVNRQFCFIDLPGYGYAKVPAAEIDFFRRLVELYLMNKGHIAGVVQIVDARHGSMEKDEEMIRWLRNYKKPFFVVFNKSDKLNRREKIAAQKGMTQRFGEDEAIFFSSKTGLGKKSLWKWIESRLKCFESERLAHCS